MQEMSDEEIFEAVMECRSAQEDAPNMGGDNVDDTLPCEPTPSHCEVLHAALIINQYVQSLIHLHVRWKWYLAR
jgi:hypothetical protein